MCRQSAKQNTSKQNVGIEQSNFSDTQIAMAGGNLIQISISVFGDIFENRIREYIRQTERRLLSILFVVWLIIFFLPQVRGLFPISDGIIHLFTQIANLFAFLVIFWITGAIIYRNIKNSKTFWGSLSKTEKENINKYLKELKNSVSKDFEYTFRPDENYVALSGNLYPHQAYEDRTPGRRYIPNLDKYLRHPNHKRIFIYGSPGSGKSTTLYKTFLNYKQDCESCIGNYIPVFIHAKEINAISNLSESSSFTLIDFIEAIYANNQYKETRSFVKIVRQDKVNLVLIIDALDEFTDKKHRSQLFDFLSRLIKKTSSTECKWILSCREEEYRAYKTKLQVNNVRIQPMNLRQVREFVMKRGKTLKEIYGFSKQIEHSILKSIDRSARALEKAEGKAEDNRETFLSNPYYLSLWLQLIDRSPNENLEPRIPSIDQLHIFELRREIAKGMEKSPTDYEDKAIDSLIDDTISILSVLSFHLLKVSLEYGTTNGVRLTDPNLIRTLYKKFKSIKNHKYDSLTSERIKFYSETTLTNPQITNTVDDINIDFVELLKLFRLEVFSNDLQLDTINNNKLTEFSIFVASIIEQAKQNGLIKFDIPTIKLSGFFNQRAGDYLSACYLKEYQLSSILRQGKINFWLSRSIAISIAISQNPERILDLKKIPKDAVLETSIVDGLTLIQSEHKKEIQAFVNSFIVHLLDQKRLIGESADPCDPLRVLREVQRLLLGGYAQYIDLNKYLKLFKKLLNSKDTGISELAAMTLLTYACQVDFKGNLYRLLVSYWIRRSIKSEFIFEGAIKNIKLTIEEANK